jgi:hypothetical protein
LRTASIFKLDSTASQRDLALVTRTTSSNDHPGVLAKRIRSKRCFTLSSESRLCSPDTAARTHVRVCARRPDRARASRPHGQRMRPEPSRERREETLARIGRSGCLVLSTSPSATLA